MCRNCASRSGCWRPSLVLTFACRLYPSPRSSCATVVKCAWWPSSRNPSARCLTLLEVHRNSDSGSPRLSASTSRSRSSSNVAIDLGQRLAPAARPTHPPRLEPLPGLKLSDPLADRRHRDPRRTRRRRDPTPPRHTRLAGRPQPPLTLVQLTRQRPELLTDRSLIRHTAIVLRA